MSDTGWTFSKWWEENKEQRNLERRQRYAKNPVYREKVLDQNRKRREVQRREAEKRRKEEHKAKKASVHPGFEELENVELDDGTVFEGKLYTIGAVAHAIRRSVQTVRIWEKKGLIETTPYRRAKRGDRLYSSDMILEIRNRVVDLGYVKAEELEVLLPKASTKSQVFHLEVRFADGTMKRMRLYRIGYLADVLDRSTSAVLRMERNGYIPETTLRTSGNHRLYSFAMIMAASDAMDEFYGSVANDDWDKFREAVTAAWEASGCLGASVVDRTIRTGDGDEED